MENEKFSKYETARILGARALQIAMNAPFLIKMSAEDLEKINYDSLKIAEIELNSGVLPISIRKPFPEKKEGILRKAKEVRITDRKKENLEAEEEEDIVKSGEIMELAVPDDEGEEEANDDNAEED
jgi:DNA-directed RNA polymerase subunit K